jgi:hypothetical protein
MGNLVLVGAAALVTYLGLGLLAVCQRSNWRSLCTGAVTERPLPEARRRARWVATPALIIGLVSSFAAQGPAFGALLFTLLLGAASLAVTFTLTYRPQWLRPLRRALARDPG